MTNTKTILLFVLGISFSFTTLGIHTPIPTPLLQINANNLPTHNWASSLNNNMSTSLCQENSHWRKCYEIKTDACIQLINALTQGCTAKMLTILPQTLSPSVASLAGKQVGFCVGELFYQLAQDKLKSATDCQKKPE